jgi:pimeloyl-ACP methyl ester carboxylesterase
MTTEPGPRIPARRLTAVVLGISILSVLGACNVVEWKRGRYERVFARSGLRPMSVRLGPDEIHLWEGGKGPPVVLIHGFGADAIWQWSSQAEALAPRHRLIVPDLLWFGASISSERDFTPAHQVRAVSALLSKLGVGRADLVGISYGGIVAYELARLHPERVRRLVLLDSAGRFYTDADYRELCKRFAVDDISKVLIPDDVATVRRQLELAYDDPPYMPDFAARQVLRDLVTYRAEKRALLDALLRERSGAKPLSPAETGAAVLSRIPTLLIWGRDDPIFPLDLGHRLAAGIGAQLRIINHARHAPNLEHPEEVNQALVEFIERDGDRRP